MSELDEVYDSYDSTNRQYSKEEYAEYKKQEKQEIYSLIDSTAEKIVTNGKEFQKYLDTQSKFDNYSVGNTLLVTAQNPKATQLRDYDGWSNSGAYPKRFSKGIKILEPGDEYMREDGSVGINYNVKKVYDISQVTARQKPRITNYNDKIMSKIFLSSNLSKIQLVDEIPGTDKGAMYNFNDDTLYIARGAEAPKIFHELSQELAKQEIGESSSLDTFKAYCVSYMLCKRYNIDVSNYDFKEIPPQLQDMEAKEIREELEPMRNAMESINTRMSAFVQKLARENRNKENVR